MDIVSKNFRRIENFNLQGKIPNFEIQKIMKLYIDDVLICNTLFFYCPKIHLKEIKSTL